MWSFPLLQLCKLRAALLAQIIKAVLYVDLACLWDFSPHEKGSTSESLPFLRLALQNTGAMRVAGSSTAYKHQPLQRVLPVICGCTKVVFAPLQPRSLPASTDHFNLIWRAQENLHVFQQECYSGFSFLNPSFLSPFPLIMLPALLGLLWCRRIGWITHFMSRQNEDWSHFVPGYLQTSSRDKGSHKVPGHHLIRSPLHCPA